MRFGIGEIPREVLEVAKAARRARLVAERDNLRHTNPRIAKASAGAQRLAELNAAIAGED